MYYKKQYNSTVLKLFYFYVTHLLHKETVEHSREKNVCERMLIRRVYNGGKQSAKLIMGLIVFLMFHETVLQGKRRELSFIQSESSRVTNEHRERRPEFDELHSA